MQPLFCLSRRMFASAAAAASFILLASSIPATAEDHDKDHIRFFPGNLVVSRSVYDNNANNVEVGTILPPNCASTVRPLRSAAINNGTYPFVFNNDTIDASFGITSKIFLDQITPFGFLINTSKSPTAPSITSTPAATSSSPASAPSPNSRSISPPMASSSPSWATSLPSTPSTSRTPTRPVAIDSTNPVGVNFYRAVATVDRNGNFTFTETNAYSGNNGRAAILNNTNGANFFYTAGNAGNGANPQPNGSHPRRGHTIHRSLHRARELPDPRHPHPGRQLLRHPPRRQG